MCWLRQAVAILVWMVLGQVTWGSLPMTRVTLAFWSDGPRYAPEDYLWRD
jgi:hypothetical protein